jgi:hypothetical protein
MWGFLLSVDWLIWGAAWTFTLSPVDSDYKNQGGKENSLIIISLCWMVWGSSKSTKPREFLPRLPFQRTVEIPQNEHLRAQASDSEAAGARKAVKEVSRLLVHLPQSHHQEASLEETWQSIPCLQSPGHSVLMWGISAGRKKREEARSPCSLSHTASGMVCKS